MQNKGHALTNIYLPGLNGIRAIAALAVVLTHITLALDQFGLNNSILGTGPEGKPRGLDLADYGVTMFFTLSGFLITYLLLKEKEANQGKIKIKDFYIRRILRIWPLYYAILILSIATFIYFGLPYETTAIPFYIFLAANVPFILGNTLPLLAHYWSLGVEEQFYLLFPHLAKQSNKKLLNTAIIGIYLFIVLKFSFLMLERKYGAHTPLLSVAVTRFHIMLIGAIGAILFYEKNTRFIELSTKKITQIISWTIVFLLALNQFTFVSLLAGEIVAVITVFIIIGQITKTNHLINLENPVCDFIGKISYGIYVIHPILIFYASKLLGTLNPEKMTSYALVYSMVITSTIVLAYLSYELFEKRFLKLKYKYSTIRSINTR